MKLLCKTPSCDKYKHNVINRMYDERETAVASVFNLLLHAEIFSDKLYLIRVSPIFKNSGKFF